MLVAAYGITQFLLSPLTGSLSDRYGRKTFILAGLVIFNAAKLLFALGDVLWMLYAKSITFKYAMLFMLVLVMTFGLANYEAVLGLYVTTRFQFTAQHIAIILNHRSDNRRWHASIACRENGIKLYLSKR
ncbi:hypothetical protein SAMN04488689_11071 [Paenibacillus sp. cl6col]|nr:hypothetical protein SAMN04488689_11071 [Paenibacillus sp. cl6col]